MNLRNAKCVLMAKNVFMALNCEDKLWIHIAHLKYGTFHCWLSNKGKNVSSFYRALTLAASKFKACCWIKECNRIKTDFLGDPWLFETQLHLNLLL